MPPSAQDDRLLRLPEVLERTGVQKTKLYDLIKAGRFPEPRKIGRGSRWRLSDVAAFVAA